MGGFAAMTGATFFVVLLVGYPWVAATFAGIYILGKIGEAIAD